MCGVIGVYSPDRNAVEAVISGLQILQHRGQEAAGLAYVVDDGITAHHQQGPVSHRLVSDVAGMFSHMASGQVRYSTTGSSTWDNAQPIHRYKSNHAFALGHNGNVISRNKLRLDQLEWSDSQLIAESLELTLAQMNDLAKAMVTTMEDFIGAYSLIVMSATEIIGLRDPLGIRPLCYGKLGEGWAVASESCALDVLGATEITELAPGELVRIGAAGAKVERFAQANSKVCAFEYVYFARPDSVINGVTVEPARFRMGQELAEVAPVEADGVVGVPLSGIPAAMGYAQASGIPFINGLVKNDSIGRSFTARKELRSGILGLKHNVIRENVAGKRLIVVDDSVVRANTLKRLVKLLFKFGALEVHVRISSPPYRWPCFYGLDTATLAELIAANYSVAEIRHIIASTSLAYLPIEALVRAISLPQDELCLACLNGKYPTEIDERQQEILTAKVEVQQMLRTPALPGR